MGQTLRPRGDERESVRSTPTDRNDTETPGNSLNPSAENLARYFYGEIRERLKRETNGRVKVRDVTIFETETTTATYFE